MNSRGSRASKRDIPTDLHIGSRLRARRLELGISQQQLGEQIKISYQQVQKYERGTNRIGAALLWRLGAVLGVPLEYFFEAAGSLALRRSTSLLFPFGADDCSDRETLQAARTYRSIPDPEVRRHARLMLASLARASQEYSRQQAEAEAKANVFAGASSTEE